MSKKNFFFEKKKQKTFDYVEPIGDLRVSEAAGAANYLKCR